MLVILLFILPLESQSEISVSQVELSEDDGSYEDSSEQSSDIIDETDFKDHYDAHYSSLDLSKKTFESNRISFNYFRFS